VKQELFERAREERWRRFEALLDAPPRAARDEDFPRRYRVLCQDLALAQDRGFDAALVERLNALALRGHQRFYGARGHPVRPIEFLARGFPAAVRREARIIGWISLLFFGSMTLFFALDVTRPTLIYHLLSGAQVVQFEEMYDPAAAHYGAPRDTAGDFAAFAYYVGNNVGVAFRTFAWGLFFGVGTAGIVTATRRPGPQTREGPPSNREAFAWERPSATAWSGRPRRGRSPRSAPLKSAAA